MGVFSWFGCYNCRELDSGRYRFNRVAARLEDGELKFQFDFTKKGILFYGESNHTLLREIHPELDEVGIFRRMKMWETRGLKT